MKNKKYIICSIIAFLILIIGVLIIGCTRKKEFNKTALIELSENSGVPYNWEYKIENEDIAKLDKKDTKDESGKNITGGQVTLKFYFKGVSEGNTTITFNYKSITDETVTDTKVYNVIVDKKLQIKIEEIN